MPAEVVFINKIAVFVINVTGLTLLLTVLFSTLSPVLKRIYILMTLFMFMWVDFAFLARLSSITEVGLFFIRIAWSITPLLFVLVFAFLVNFFQVFNKYKKLTSFLYIWGALFLFLTPLTRLIIKNIFFEEGVLHIVYGDLSWAFFGSVLLFTILSFVVLIRQYKFPHVSRESKKVIHFILVGLTVFFVANAIFNIFFPVFKGLFSLYEFGDYSTIVFFVLLTYATARHNIFGFKVVAVSFLTIFLGSFLAVNALVISSSTSQRITNSIVFALYVPFGYFLVKSVKSEIEQKEKFYGLTERLKVLDAQKDEFISMAAHELRAPMTAIKGYISMVLEGDAGDIPEKARGFLADANNINDRLIRLVNNMLNVSRIEEGKMVYQMEEENLSRIVRAVFNQFIPEAERKGLKYALEIQPEVKDKVYVDPDRIHEVVGNLISNAIKYTDRGSVKVELKQPTRETVRCEVVDTGPGISEQEQKKLFQKFQRAETSIGKTTGTGLGLYISKLLIERFKGKIGVKSAPGVGSTFWFELPLAS